MSTPGKNKFSTLPVFLLPYQPYWGLFCFYALALLLVNWVLWVS